MDVAGGCHPDVGLTGWATVITCRTAPQPERFLSTNGSVLMTGEDIVAGKAGFQKADLMAWNFVVKLRPLYPAYIERLIPAHSGHVSRAAAE